MTYNDYMALNDQLMKIGDSFYQSKDSSAITSSCPYSIDETFMLGFIVGAFSKLKEQYRKEWTDKEVTFTLLRELRGCKTNHNIVDNIREAITRPLKDLTLMIGNCDKVTTLFIEYRLRVKR